MDTAGQTDFTPQKAGDDARGGITVTSYERHGVSYQIECVFNS